MDGERCSPIEHFDYSHISLLHMTMLDMTDALPYGAHFPYMSQQVHPVPRPHLPYPTALIQ